jgi:hypothetical protein
MVKQKSRSYRKAIDRWDTIVQYMSDIADTNLHKIDVNGRVVHEKSCHLRYNML